MNSKNQFDDFNAQTENVELENPTFRKKYSDAILANTINLRNTIRMRFAQKCEESVLSRLMDSLYYKFLNCSIKAFAIFLTTLGVLSLFFSYILEFNGVPFFFNINTVSSLVILLIGILFLTTKKTVAELLLGSASLSKLSIVYSQSAVFSANTQNTSNQNSYSTALFVGIIAGIVSINFPAVYLVVFFLSIIYCLFIFNRPECGLMLILVAVPLLNNIAVLTLCIVTILSVIYKYLRGKRHIDANFLLLMCIFSIVYFAFRGFFTITGDRNFVSTASYLAFVFIFIITVSLIRSTSMLTRTINLIVTVSRLYLVIFIGYYISCVIFGINIADLYISLPAFEGLKTSITNMSFFALLLSISIPLNFAVMISSKNASGFIKNVVFFVLMIVCTVFVSTFEYTFITLLMCALILVFLKKRYAFFAVAVPLISFGMNTIFKIIPENYIVKFFAKNQAVDENVLTLIRKNLLFGIGIGENNAEIAIYELSDGVVTAANTGSTYLSLLLTVGVFGSLLILSMIALMLIKNAEFIINFDQMQSNKVRILSAGIFSSSLSFILNSLFLDCTRDFRIVCLFAIVLSLGFACKKCFDADYIDTTTVREYK